MFLVVCVHKKYIGTTRLLTLPGNVLEFVFSGTLIPVLNEKIVAEYREVLMRKKFHLTEDIVEDIISALEEQGEYINPESMGYRLPDPKDVVFYAVVMKKRKDDEAYLVTGNIKHFPVEPFVVTPREMLDILLGKDNV